MMSREKSVKVGILMSLEGRIFSRGCPKSLYPPHPRVDEHETAPHWSTGLWEPLAFIAGQAQLLPLTEGRSLCASSGRPKSLGATLLPLAPLC